MQCEKCRAETPRLYPLTGMRAKNGRFVDTVDMMAGNYNSREYLKYVCKPCAVSGWIGKLVPVSALLFAALILFRGEWRVFGFFAGLIIVMFVVIEYGMYRVLTDRLGKDEGRPPSEEEEG